MNVTETQQNVLKENSDDDDEPEEYFLQATPGAYDMKEKIRIANDELFEDYETYINTIREQRVTFKADLVDYEPDYSSDDGYVQSPDALSLSDNENEHIYERDQPSEHHSLEPISEISNHESCETDDENPAIENETHENENEKCDIDDLLNENEESQSQPEEVNDKLDETMKEEEETIVEEEDILTDNSEPSEQLKSECNNKVSNSSNENDTTDEEEISEEEKSVEVIEIINDTEDDLEDTKTDDSSETDAHMATINDEEDNTNETLDNKTNKRCSTKIDKVNCHIHCLEKKELDLITGGCKNIVDISKGPSLKLRQRPCCTNLNTKPRLPVYNGLISEYGLSKTQLEKRKCRKEKSVQRKREKSKRISEEKRQKDIFNEEIFCAWLKSVRQRNQNNNKENMKSKNSTSQARQRPKTCHISTCVKEKIRKRPNTSPCKSCSYTTILVTPTVTIKEVLTFQGKLFECL